MRRTLATFLLSTSLLSSPAMADHMNGTYQGTREAAGITLQLTQNDRTLNGKLSGAVTATLTGITDGGDIATGSLQLPAGEAYGYTARWSSAGFDMFVFTPQGAMAYAFTTAAGAPPADGPGDPGDPGAPGKPGAPGEPPAQPGPPAAPPPPPPPAPPPPPPPPPPEVRVDYYLLDGNRQPIGPFTLQEVMARIADGRAKPSDLVWKDGLPSWVEISTLDEFK